MVTPGEIEAARARHDDNAAKRYVATREEREANETRRRALGVAVLDTDEQLEARASRLARRGDIPVDAMLDVVRAAELARPLALERIIGATKDLQAASFLARGARAAATVARISYLDRGRELPIGTGFLVSPRLLLTNNHVLPDVDTTQQVVAEFAAEVDIDNMPISPTRYRLAPDVFFVTEEALDFTLVAVRPGVDGRLAGETFGWNRLIVQQGKIVIGEPVNIVGHPAGRLKEIAIRNNALTWQLDNFLHYATDTEPGNSGSPVFNDQWEVVALHHAGVPGDDGQWVANEGTRVSVILKHLVGVELSEQMRTVLAEMGLESGVASPAGVPATPLVVGAAAPLPEVAGRRRGLAARPTAFGGSRHLAFLHGRGQEGKDPAALRRSWTAGLNEGLTLGGANPIDAADVWFPFYADRMAEALRARESVVVPFDTIDAIGAEPAESLAPSAPASRLIYEEMIAEAAARAGMPQEYAAEEGLRTVFGTIVGKLQRQLSWLAARSGLDDLVIAQVFRDVSAYLADSRVRDIVLDAVLETMPRSGQLTLVGHSLGSVVALDLVTKLPPAVDVEVLVTVGSPLGLDTVYKRLLVGGPRRPSRVGRWLNVWCAADPVAIGCPLRDDWRGQLDEVVVDNPTESAHSIREYMSHAHVARSVVAAL